MQIFPFYFDKTLYYSVQFELSFITVVSFFVRSVSFADKNATIPAPVEHCETVFSFEVTHDMAPMSRILVYYVLENDEGVADSLTLDVAPSFENQVGF